KPESGDRKPERGRALWQTWSKWWLKGQKAHGACHREFFAFFRAVLIDFTLIARSCEPSRCVSLTSDSLMKPEPSNTSIQCNDSSHSSSTTPIFAINSERERARTALR